MRHLRVCIYGGTHLDRVAREFIAELASQLLDKMPAVIVTGGFLHSKQTTAESKPTRVSTDVAALEGARRYAATRQRVERRAMAVW